MNLSVGIIGFPNVGKSTLFNALLSRKIAAAENYPFCTIKPNIGVVQVPDKRLPKLAKIAGAQKIVPAAVEFVDVAGLVKGANKGAGLGNQFLAQIRQVNTIIYVLRDFRGANIIRQESKNPQDDFESLATELQLADLQQIQKIKKPKGSGSKEEIARWNAANKAVEMLQQGKFAAQAALSSQEKKAIKSLSLLTLKPIIIVLNSDTQNLNKPAPLKAKPERSVIRINAKIAEETAEGTKKSALDKLIQAAYKTLGLITMFTAGEIEARAWPVKKGASAQKAAGAIHSDFSKNFIKARVVSYSDFIKCGGWKGVKSAGKLRFEGKSYLVREGDVVEFMVSA